MQREMDERDGSMKVSNINESIRQFFGTAGGASLLSTQNNQQIIQQISHPSAWGGIFVVRFQKDRRERAMEEMTVQATVDNVEVVTDFINKQLDALHCPIPVKIQIDIAIDEIFLNSR